MTARGRGGLQQLELDRGEFLRRGAGGLIAAAATGLLAGEAAAAPPVPMPRGDDVAYLSFATVGERAIRDFYHAALGQPGVALSVMQRRHFARVAFAKREHIMRLDTALGADAPLTSDFVTVLPKDVVSTRKRILTFGEQLETLLVRVYLSGVAYAQDSATRLLLGRFLAYDVEQIAWLRGPSGLASPAGLLSPIDLEAASGELDQFLSTPAFPD